MLVGLSLTFMNYRYYCHLCTTFRSQQTSHMEPSATSTTVAVPVGEHLQAGTGDAPVLDRPAPLRRLHDSGAWRKYDLVPYSLYKSDYYKKRVWGDLVLRDKAVMKRDVEAQQVVHRQSNVMSS